MYPLIKVGAIVCWALAIASEYVVQMLPRRKKLLNWTAAALFALALFGEYAGYRIDAKQQAELERRISAQGIEVTEWLQGQDTREQTMTTSSEPLPGTVAVLINGLLEPSDVFRTRGREVTITTSLSRTDRITIRYRRSAGEQDRRRGGQ